MTFENPSGDPASQPYPPAQPYPIPGQSMPGQPMPGPADQPYPPTQPMQPMQPGQQWATPGQSMPGQPLPGQQIPGQPMSGPTAQQWEMAQPMTGFAPPPPPNKPRTGLIVALSTVAVLGVAGIVFAVTSTGGTTKAASQAAPSQSAIPSSATVTEPSSPAASTDASSAADAGGSVVLPASAGGLKQLTGSAGQAVTNAMKKADESNPMLSGALFGAYSKSGSSEYYSDLTLVPLSSASSLQTALSASDADTVISTIAQSAGLTGAATETPAVSDGAMSCGIDKTADITLRMCMWIDNDEYGLAAYPDSISNSQAATYSNALWKASEQG